MPNIFIHIVHQLTHEQSLTVSIVSELKYNIYFRFPLTGLFFRLAFGAGEGSVGLPLEPVSRRAERLLCGVSPGDKSNTSILTRP
jgi:hypothetical protein